jgi:heat shock protein HslJ
VGILAGVAAFGAACTQEGSEPPTDAGAAEASISEDELSRVEGVASEITGTLSLADLGGVEWVLTHFGWKDPAPPEPAITLIFEGERIVGSSGCNRYFSGVEAGKAPGELKIGPVGATRMACPEDQMAMEDRYLKGLGRVVRFAFVTGRLVLTWSQDDATGSMLFAPRQPGADSMP